MTLENNTDLTAAEKALVENAATTKEADRQVIAHRNSRSGRGRQGQRSN